MASGWSWCLSLHFESIPLLRGESCLFFSVLCQREETWIWQSDTEFALQALLQSQHVYWKTAPTGMQHFPKMGMDCYCPLFKGGEIRAGIGTAWSHNSTGQTGAGALLLCSVSGCFGFPHETASFPAKTLLRSV